MPGELTPVSPTVSQEASWAASKLSKLATGPATPKRQTARCPQVDVEAFRQLMAQGADHCGPPCRSQAHAAALQLGRGEITTKARIHLGVLHFYRADACSTLLRRSAHHVNSNMPLPRSLCLSLMLQTHTSIPRPCAAKMRGVPETQRGSLPSLQRGKERSSPSHLGQFVSHLQPFPWVSLRQFPIHRLRILTCVQSSQCRVSADLPPELEVQ